MDQIIRTYNPSYTPDEQKKIVDYIVEHEAYSLIKGDMLWKTMEKAQIVNRTWQSLKQHFRKRIIREIQYPRYNLSKSQQQQFLKYFNRTDLTRKNTSRKNAGKKKNNNKQNKCREVSCDLQSSSSDSDSFMSNLVQTTGSYDGSNFREKRRDVASEQSFTSDLGVASTSSLTFTLDSSDSDKEQGKSVKNAEKSASTCPQFNFDTSTSSDEDDIFIVEQREPECIVIE